MIAIFMNVYEGKAAVSDYEMRPALASASVEDYVELFRSSFADDKLTDEYLQWQYLDNPHGRVIGMDAFADDKLVAHYAIIPRRYAFGTQRFNAALSVNTATHPDHQGKGLFTRLASQTYDLAATLGVQFIVGAANANSVGGFLRKLGFSSLGQIRLYLACNAVPAQKDVLDIEVDADWLAWRFVNPARTYSAAAPGGGWLDTGVQLKGVRFHLARLPGSQVEALRTLPRAFPWTPGLTPYFGPRPPALGRLPLRMQPSPWHVIWRALDPNLPADLPARLRLDGVGMDTF